MADTFPSDLDPAHILGICAPATGGRRGLAIRINDGLCVCLPSRRAARSAYAALARVGYQVVAAPGGRERDLIVTGWNADGLEARLTAMRGVAHQLAENPMATAAASLDRYRNLPGTPSARQVFEQAQAELHTWVAARSGIHVPHDPAIQPREVGLALRLRASWALEQAIEGLVARQLRATAHTLGLFATLRERMPEDRAQQTALQWVGTGVHLGNSAAQGTPPLTQGLPPAPAKGSQQATPRIAGPRPTPRQATVLEFPAGITGTVKAARSAKTTSPGHRPRLPPRPSGPKR